jgi:segregation and condensation protein B
MEDIQIKAIVEAMLISTEEPLTLDQMKVVLDNTETPKIKDAIKNLRQEYSENDRSFEINEVAGGYQIGTKIRFAKYLRKLFSNKHSERLSKPSLETLAIIAYKQPVTRLEVEEIRGVNVDGVVRNLLEKGLIKIKGRKEVVGRPFLYGTSNLFLKYFGLKTLADLPPIEQFKEVANEIAQEDNDLPTDEEASDLYNKTNVNEDEEAISLELENEIKAKQKSDESRENSVPDENESDESEMQVVDEKRNQDITKESKDGTQKATQED